MCSSSVRAAWIRGLLGISVVPLLGGCGSIPVTVTSVPSYAKGTRTEGAVYVLPKSLVQVDLVVKMAVRPTESCGAGGAGYSASTACALVANAADISIEQPTISSVSVPDEQAAFSIQTDGTFVVKTEFTASFNDRGELASASSKSTDQTLQFVALGLETAAKVGAAVAMAGPNARADGRDKTAVQIRALRAAIAEVERRMAATASELGAAQPAARKPADKGAQTSPPRKLSEIVEEYKTLLDLRSRMAAAADELEKSLVTELSVPVRCVVEPSAVAADMTVKLNEKCEAYSDIKSTLDRLTVGLPDGLPSLTLLISPVSAPAAGPAGAAPPRQVDGRQESWSGFVYRVPVWARVELTTDARSRVLATVPVPQWGGLGVWKIDEGDLRAGKTVSVELHPGLGSVKTVTLNGEPVPVADVSKAVDAAAKLPTVGQEAAVAKLQREKAQVDAERELEEAKKALRESREDSE